MQKMFFKNLMKNFKKFFILYIKIENKIYIYVAQVYRTKFYSYFYFTLMYIQDKILMNFDDNFLKIEFL